MAELDDDFIVQYQLARDIIGQELNKVRNRIVDDRAAIASYVGARNSISLPDGTVYKKITTTLAPDGVFILPVANDATKRWIPSGAFSGVDAKKHAGAVGDGVTNDTPAMKRALQQVVNPRVDIPWGNYLTDGITLPAEGAPINNQNAQNISLIDGGAGGFNGATLKARSGVETLLRINNMAGAVYRNITLIGAADTGNMLDLSWIGTLAGGAPSNQCHVQNVWIQGGTGAGKIAANFDQLHDSLISDIKIQTSCEWGLSLQGGGGWWQMDNLKVFGGKTRLAAQNGAIIGGYFEKGMELTGASFNLIHLEDCHFLAIANDAIKSVGSGNACRGLKLTNCNFNAPIDSAGAAFSGRFWSGAKCENCWFESGVLTRNIVAAAGDGSAAFYPRFRFENCSYGNPIVAPVGCVYEFINCINSNGQIFSQTMGAKWQLQGGIQTDSIYVRNISGSANIQLHSPVSGNPFLDFLAPDGSVKNRLIDAGSSLYFDGNQPIDFNGAWNAANPLRLSGYRLWVDSAGRMRMKQGNPISDTDGTIIGTQS